MNAQLPAEALAGQFEGQPAGGFRVGADLDAGGRVDDEAAAGERVEDVAVRLDAALRVLQQYVLRGIRIGAGERFVEVAAPCLARSKRSKSGHVAFVGRGAHPVLPALYRVRALELLPLGPLLDDALGVRRVAQLADGPYVSRPRPAAVESALLAHPLGIELAQRLGVRLLSFAESREFQVAGRGRCRAIGEILIVERALRLRG